MITLNLKEQLCKRSKHATWIFNSVSFLFQQPTSDKPQKKAKSTSKSSCCPYFFGILLVLGAIGGLLAYDTQRNDGVFEKSAAGKFLKDTGALPYVEVAWTKSLSTSARGFQWAEANVPVYLNKTIVVLQPYGVVLKDLGIVGLNAAKNGWTVTKEYVATKTPIVANFVSTFFLLRSGFFLHFLMTWHFDINLIRLLTWHKRKRLFILTLKKKNNKIFTKIMQSLINLCAWGHML